MKSRKPIRKGTSNQIPRRSLRWVQDDCPKRLRVASRRGAVKGTVPFMGKIPS
jgi:hypothetical protein